MTQGEYDALPAVETMTTPQMRDEFVSLAAPLGLISNRRKALWRQITVREAEARAQAKVLAMSPEEIAALRSALQN